LQALESFIAHRRLDAVKFGQGFGVNIRHPLVIGYSGHYRLLAFC
jgi:hypothetical protein